MADDTPAMGPHALLLPETLHLVLVNLSQLDLLLSQRVCRTWRAAIQETLVLQQRLCFQPDYNATVGEGKEAETNALLREHFDGLFVPADRHDRALGPFRHTRWHKEHARRSPDSKKLTAYAYKTASWRRMLPRQPPPTHFHLVVEIADGEGMHVRFRDRTYEISPQRNYEHLTFGLIYDLMQSHTFPSSASISDISAIVKAEIKFPQSECSSVTPNNKPLEDMDESEKLEYYREVSVEYNRPVGPGCMSLHLRKNVDPEEIDVEIDNLTCYAALYPGAMDETSCYAQDYLRSQGARVAAETNLGDLLPWEVDMEFNLRF